MIVIDSEIRTRASESKNSSFSFNKIEQIGLYSTHINARGLRPFSKWVSLLAIPNGHGSGDGGGNTQNKSISV